MGVSGKKSLKFRSALAVCSVAGSGLLFVSDLRAEDSVAKSSPEKIEAVQGAQPKDIKLVPATVTLKPQTVGAIAVKGAPGRSEVLIPLGTGNPRFSVTRISDPERLVVDIDSAELANIRSIKPNGLEFVSNIRVGAHPNKTRVVIDLLAKNSSIAHESRVDGGSLIIAVTAGALKVTAQVSEQDRLKSQPEGVKQLVNSVAKTGVAEPAAKQGAKPLAKPVANPVSEPAAKLVVESVVEPAVKPIVKQDVEPVAKSAVKPVVAEQAKPLVPDRAMLAPKALENSQVKTQARIDTKPLASFEPPKVDMLLTKLINPERFTTGVNLSKEVLSKGAPSKEPIVRDLQVNSDVALKRVPEKQATEKDPAKEEPQELKEEERLEQVKKVSSEAKEVENLAKSPLITSVTLEGGEKISPAVVIKVDERISHFVTRTAPSEYVVTLRDVLVSDELKQKTIFASQESSGIRSVRTVTDGEHTLVRIFTQPSSYLTARREGDTLRIEETQDLAQIARDIRAQIAPAAVNAGAVSKEGAKDVALDEAKSKSEDASGDRSSPGTPNRERANPREGELATIKGLSQNYTGRLISLDLQDADIDSALRIIAEVSNLNIVAGDGVVGKVTLKLVDVPWDQALEVILKSHGLDKVLEGNVLRVAPVDKLRTERESFKQARVAEEELEPLSVKYMRVSYAKAAEIKGLVETVLTDRGTVAFDERSNQLVVKDTRKGLSNVGELVKKIDLRTPQILLETQIIEANRNLSRQLGAELGFQYIQSPATGNGTGLNFPSAISVGGSADAGNPTSITGSAFPVPSTAALGSAVTMLFDSADGTKSLALRLSQLEQEGQVRIISKPAVATTNNKAAEIKSVEKYRVKLPNGGLSIASGSGASSSGSGDVATQTIEAGIVLNVTPQASPDYYILLDIRAKSSSFGAKSVDGIPNEIERSASSSVLVSSGQTFALGGIYKITEQDRVSGVPFFKDIPVLGTFFRNTTTEQSDEELLFFITPRIVEGSFEDATPKVIS